LNCLSQFFSWGSWLESALSTPNGKKGFNSSAYLNSITNSSVQLQCIQAIEAHIQPTKPQANPKRNLVCKSAPHRPQYCTFIYEFKNKYPLATKYLKKLTSSLASAESESSGLLSRCWCCTKACRAQYTIPGISLSKHQSCGSGSNGAPGSVWDPNSQSGSGSRRTKIENS
jgi:hypothetical protein